METTAQLPAQQLTTKALFGQDNVRKKFEELLGKRAPQFITSVLQIASSNELLAHADPMSIYNAAATAATLDLPLNNNLGFAYIVPYNQKQKDGKIKTVAQFQMGYKGFIQLAQRSGQFKTISATPIYEGQLVVENPLTGFEFDFTKKKEGAKVIGYAAYFELINGFQKTLFMTAEQLTAHGVKYSQTFKRGFGLWKDEFDSMATKTVLKLLLAKFAPLSIEMQKAVVTDQSIINDAETEDVTYIDNSAEVAIDKTSERITLMIADAKSMEELNALKPKLKAEHAELFDQKRLELETQNG